MKIVLPLRAEFGLKIWWFVPAVHGYEGRPKIVYIEPGEEALYPSADMLITIERQQDPLRRNRYARDRDFVAQIEAEARATYGAHGAEYLKPDTTWPRKRFIPEPVVRDGIVCDVVVAPRKRLYGSAKNWPHWTTLINGLRAGGHRVFAAGAPDSSYEVEIDHAWSRERYLDATIEALLSARLVVATDAGIANLAVLCGRPLLMITHGEGIVAPGPSVDETGRVMDLAYWPVKVERYREANYLGSPIRLLYHAWEDPGLVIDTASRYLDLSKSFPWLSRGMSL